MNTQNLMHKTKLFMPWQDEKEEIWLQEMSRQGWHFKSVGYFGKYEFCRGESREYAYRLDYQIQQKNEKTDYLQLFADAGWEHLQDFSNWQYFRKPIQPGEKAEIFTSNESKIAKYMRVLSLWIFLLPMYIVDIAILNNYDSSSLFFDGFTIFFTLIALIYAYVSIRILVRIGQLKKQ